MSRPEVIPINRLMSVEELNHRIKTKEKDVKILKRLYFIKFRYDGDSVESADEKVVITKRIGYIWQERWNENRYDGIIPRYASGRPSKLSQQQKNDLEQLLKQKETWTTKEVRDQILEKFKKQIYIILRDMGMNFAKPYPHGYRRPSDAEDILKKLPKIDQNTVIGFLDETSPQTSANTQRLWSFGKPTICKNTTKIKANAFGFYAINGISAIDFDPNSKKESVCDFLKTIWKANIGKKIILILDSFSSHKDTRKFAEEHGINLVYLPPYSPNLNPIEFIWKSIKREVSCEFIRDVDHMKNLIRENFCRFSVKHSFAANWIDAFLDNRLSIIS